MKERVKRALNAQVDSVHIEPTTLHNEVKIMFIENRIRNEQIIEKNINEKSDGFSVVG